MDHLAGLGTLGAADALAGATRRERLLASMAAVEAHEAGLFARLLDGLAKLGDVTVYGQAARRAPTAFFNVGAVGPAGGGRAPVVARVNVWDGDNYAYELCRVLGLLARGAVGPASSTTTTRPTSTAC